MSTSCKKNENEIVANKEESLNRFTSLQKQIAEKAIKMPAENNPAVLHKFNADPAVLVYNDTVYIYCTNDSQQAEFSLGKADNAYDKINTLNVFSSKDLVNWTDCGIIKVAGPNGAAKWARNSWAPAICTKKIDGKDKFFLYFADSANGIGVLSADSPVGPYVDPIGKALVSRGMPGIDGVHWLFDPAVIVDDDGTGYIYFGGGHQEEFIHPKSARCAQLGDDMISLATVPAEIDAPFLFEDSGINKIGDTYYYSYCSNWQSRDGVKANPMIPIAVIAYMTSKNPLGPFVYKGYTLENPGTAFGAWGNNHHWIFSFRGKWYIAYHTQVLEKTVGCEKGGYRNVFIDNFAVNADGSLPKQKMTKKGVDQLCNFKTGESVPAATFARSANVAVTAKQTIVSVKDGAYVCIKGVEFTGKESEFALQGIVADGKAVKVNIDAAGGNGKEICEVKGGKKKELSGKLSATSGVHDLYILLPQGTELISWIVK